MASGHIHTAKILGDRNFLDYVVNTYAKWLELMCRNGPRRVNSLVLQWPVWAKNPNQDFTLFKADLWEWAIASHGRVLVQFGCKYMQPTAESWVADLLIVLPQSQPTLFK